VAAAQALCRRVHFLKPGPRCLPRHILIVEDDASIAGTTQAALRQEGEATWEISNALNGEEALQMIAKRQVDLLLLDVRLPVISGAENYRRLRAAPATECLPIIFLSGGTSFDLSREGIQEGVLLRKLFNLSELVGMVRAKLPDANNKPVKTATN
jgi:DNA-binding response OmpR family regulator